jgi:hypothetical protein
MNKMKLSGRLMLYVTYDCLGNMHCFSINSYIQAKKGLEAIVQETIPTKPRTAPDLSAIKSDGLDALMMSRFIAVVSMNKPVRKHSWQI